MFSKNECGTLINYNNSVGIISAPSYKQTIEWVFSYVSTTKKTNIDYGENKSTEGQESQSIRVRADWLEYWYELLKDCPLKYEFTGRLLSWFRQNKYVILETPTIADNTFSIYKWEYGKGWQCLTTVDYFESMHDGILKIFKLIKND